MTKQQAIKKLQKLGWQLAADQSRAGRFCVFMQYPNSDEIGCFDPRDLLIEINLKVQS